jgi:glycosyltransferase involved in cell wall biosynthesis
MTNKQMNVLLCPASDYLNEGNETGSHGQISYQFLKHLAEKSEIDKITAVTIASLDVDAIRKTTIDPLFTKANRSLNEFDSLAYYFYSFIKYIFRSEYRNAHVIHHLLPFSFGRSFNLFFIFKNSSKKYILGPIIGPHTDAAVVADETYSFSKNSQKQLRDFLYTTLTSTLLFLFEKALYKLSLITFQRADIVLFSDKHALNNHKKHLKKHQRAYILDTGIDTNVFHPTQTEKSNSLRILFVGRLTKRKGCEYLIRAVHEVFSKNPDNNLVCQIHGDGPLRGELEELVLKLGLVDHIKFLGGVSSNEEIVDRYNNSDIVCLPALSETFTVTKEALSCGKPVIVTDVCSNAERIDEGIDGFVVPPANPSSIAEVISKILDDKSLLKEMSVAALKKRERFQWSTIVNDYLLILNDEK